MDQHLIEIKYICWN